MFNGFYFSKAPWNVAGRSFDALRGYWKPGGVQIDAFGAVEVAPMPASETVPDASMGDAMGAVFATFSPSEDVTPTVWFVGRGGGPNEAAPDRKKLWFGPAARLLLTPGETSVDLNVVGMFGRDTDTPMRGYSMIARIDQGIGKVGLGLQFDQSSGHACRP